MSGEGFTHEPSLAISEAITVARKISLEGKGGFASCPDTLRNNAGLDSVSRLLICVSKWAR